MKKRIVIMFLMLCYISLNLHYSLATELDDRIISNIKDGKESGIYINDENEIIDKTVFMKLKEAKNASIILDIDNKVFWKFCSDEIVYTDSYFLPKVILHYEKPSNVTSDEITNGLYITFMQEELFPSVAKLTFRYDNNIIDLNRDILYLYSYDELDGYQLVNTTEGSKRMITINIDRPATYVLSEEAISSLNSEDYEYNALESINDDIDVVKTTQKPIFKIAGVCVLSAIIIIGWMIASIKRA